MPGEILFYITSPVHRRNVEEIASALPGRRFRAVYEAGLPWFRNGRRPDAAGRAIALSERTAPESLQTEEVRVLIFSSLQPREVCLKLLSLAVERRIPTVAIEETHQIALNDGTINNYLLPADHLLVASEEERASFEALGVPSHRIEATGWPFYHGPTGKNSPAARKEAKRRLGLDPDRPVATLPLTLLADAGETPENRARQLRIAERGLPEEFQLLLKPHPTEGRNQVRLFARRLKRKVSVLEEKTPIQEALTATDIVLNRGTSQTCIEALLQEIPVVILDFGQKTPFHSFVPGLVCRDPSDLRLALRTLERHPSPMRLYEGFFRKHIPYRPEEARQRVIRRIDEVAEKRLLDPDREGIRLELAVALAWQRQTGVALRLLAAIKSGGHVPLEPLRRLIRREASEEDIRLLRSALTGHATDSLKSILIDQIRARETPPSEQELKWLADFPPRRNILFYLPQVRAWAECLLRWRHTAEALALAERLEKDWFHAKRVNDLILGIRLHQGNRMRRTIRKALRGIRDGVQEAWPAR